MSRGAAFGVKSLFAAFSVCASLYCLLAYVPFTAVQLVKGDLFPIVNQIARMHQYLYWFLLVLAAPAIGFRRSVSSLCFWAVHLAAGIFFLVYPVLAHVESSGHGLYWALALLAPVLWLAAFDWTGAYRQIHWNSKLADQDRAIFSAAGSTGLFAALTWAAIAAARRQPGDWNVATAWLGLSASLLTHELLFVLLFVALNFAAVIASWFPSPPRAQFILCHGLGGALLYLVFQTIAFPALSFNGVESVVYSAAFSLAVTLFLSGGGLQCAVERGERIDSGLTLALWLRAAQRKFRPMRFVLAALVLVAAIAGASLVLSRNDWNFLAQKTFVLAIWILAFRLFFKAASGAGVRPSASGRLLTCALLMIPAYRSWDFAKNIAWKTTGEKQTLQHFLDQWSGYDVSFKLIRDLMTRDSGSEDFYRFLARNTNIPRSTYVAPVPVNLVDRLDYTEGKKPNIFVIVVDSLRRDYLSPYNPAVDFTPRIGRFAQESVVMENAFTHYGATGLSEPSIWVGGMLLHKQYVTPFAPMNSLQKLLEKEKYKALISRDTILEIIVPEWPGLEELDRGRPTMDYDLCASLQEMADRAASEPRDTRLFGYTQPQNIHISVINRAGAKPISGESYGGFYPAYASRLRRMDACFGSFLDRLKTEGLYDSSIVILTADHGDSLGEQGRWGHAYSIYPEIVRIPMIIHLPPQIRKSLYVNPKALAFSTDLTPTLYYLTGHKPANRGEIFGMPLFVETPEEQAGFHRSNYLIASSYGAVYGILSGDGTELSVFDSVNYKDYAFDLGALFGGEGDMPAYQRSKASGIIRDKVLALDQFYGFTPAANAVP